MKSIRELFTNLILRKHILLRSRAEYIIFFSGLAVTGLFIFASILSGNALLPLLQTASDSYMPQAISLYERGAFTNSTTMPYVPEATNVPGYPLFLALTAVPWGNVIPTLFIQALLFAISGVLLFRLFEGAFSERVRFVAALLYVVEPYTAFTVAQALSETLFLFLLISGLYAGKRAFERKALMVFFLSTVLLAAATLTRPILLYLLPLLIFGAVWFVYRESPKRALQVCIAGTLGALLVLGPWAYRNHEEFGAWLISTKGAYTLYFYDAVLLLQYRDGIGVTEAHTRLFEKAQAVYPEVRIPDDLEAPRYAPYLTRESVALIRAEPVVFVKMYVASLGTFFLSDGYRLLWYGFSGGAISLPNITKAVVTGHVDVLASYVWEHPWQAFFLILGIIFWSSVFLLSCIAVGAEFVRPSRSRLAIFICVVIIVYFALLTGPVAQARYRIVATPFLFILFAAGGSILLPMIRRYVVRHAV